jgi:hypothetical protein
MFESIFIIGYQTFQLQRYTDFGSRNNVVPNYVNRVVSRTYVCAVLGTHLYLQKFWNTVMDIKLKKEIGDKN